MASICTISASPIPIRTTCRPRRASPRRARRRLRTIAGRSARGTVTAPSAASCNTRFATPAPARAAKASVVPRTTFRRLTKTAEDLESISQLVRKTGRALSPTYTPPFPPSPVDAPFPPTSKKSKSTSTRHAGTPPPRRRASAPDRPLPRETCGQGPRAARGPPVDGRLGSFGPPGSRCRKAPLGVSRRTRRLQFGRAAKRRPGSLFQPAPGSVFRPDLSFPTHRITSTQLVRIRRRESPPGT